MRASLPQGVLQALLFEGPLGFAGLLQRMNTRSPLRDLIGIFQIASDHIEFIRNSNLAGVERVKHSVD